jgi:hypothetical protein
MWADSLPAPVPAPIQVLAHLQVSSLCIMTNFTRTAKSGGKWTLKDLDSYNITLKEADPSLFFGSQVVLG